MATVFLRPAALIFSLLLGVALGVDTSTQGLAVVSITPTPGQLFETHNITLTCTTDTTSDANFTWMSNGVELTESEVNVTVLENQLTIQYLTVGDWNSVCITCQVVTMATTGSASVILRVASLSPTFIQPPGNVTVDEGATFIINCSAIGFPEPVIFLKPEIFVYIDRGNGIFNNTDAEPTFSPGQYYCEATNNNGVTRSPIFTISVNFLEISVGPEDANFTNGTSGRLDCSARGFPQPVISWTKVVEGQTVSLELGGRVQILANGSLFFSEVIMEDLGIYKCTATNSLGNSQESDAAMVMVFVAPVFLTRPEETEVDNGESVVLVCEALAIPAPVYTWYQADCERPSVERAVVVDGRISLSGGNLTFSNVMTTDRGCYVCTADNILNQGIMSEPVELRVAALPQPPVSVSIESVGSSWITVNWTQVENYPVIVHYLVEYKLSFHSNWENCTQQEVYDEYNITNLYPSAPYDVRVRSKSPKGIGEPSPTLSAHTLPGIPKGGVETLRESVQLDSNTSDSLTVTWTVPEILLMTSYRGAYLELTHPNGTMESVRHEETEVTFTDLTPATRYPVTVFFVFAAEMQSTPSNHNATTQDGIPGDSPEITNITATSSAILLVFWTPPSLPNGEILTYTIRTEPQASSRPSVVNGSLMSYELTGLRAYTLYNVTISANTSAGEGPGSSLSARTQEGVPPALRTPTVVPVSSTSLMVSWQPLTEGEVPGVLGNYTIKYNKLHHGDHPLFVQVPPTNDSSLLDGLEPYTEYEVSVAAATGAGRGNFSEVTQSRTFGDVPITMVTLEEANIFCPAGLLVSFAELNSNGFRSPENEIRLVVNYTNLTSGEKESMAFSYSGSTSVVLRGLEVFTNYSVSVAVANNNGTGPFSQPVTGVSCDGVADAPDVTSVEPVNSTAIQLVWQQLDSSTVPGIVVNYSINYYSESINKTVSVSPDRSDHVIVGLTPYTTYHVRVATVTRYKPGPFSPSRNVITYGDVPVINLTISSVTPTCPPVGLRVTLTKPCPSDLRGPEQDISYVIKWTSTVGGVNYSRSVPLGNFTQDNQTLSYQIQSLKADVTYSFSVALSNINGTGPDSEPYEGTTSAEGVPSAPQNVSVTPNNSTSLHVTWQPPATPNGQPSYVIYYTSNMSLERSFEDESADIVNLAPYTNYSIVVVAKTTCGESRSTTVIGLTNESIPSPVSKLMVTASLPTSVTVRWKRPLNPNGRILSYTVYCPQETTSVSESTLVYDCSSLQELETYEIAVSAVNGEGASENVTVSTTTACEGPEIYVVQEETFKIKSKAKSDAIKNCTVSSLFILVVVLEFRSSSTPARPLSTYSSEELSKLNEKYNNKRGRRQASEEGVYIAANISESILESGFPLGNNEIVDNYQNHELRPGYSYNVGLVFHYDGTNVTIFVDPTNLPISIPTDPPTMPSPATDPPTMPSPTTVPVITIIAVVGGAAGLVLVAICLVGIISCCCRCYTKSLDKVETPGVRIERGGSFRLSRRKLVDPIDSFRNNHRTEALEDHPPIPVMGFLNKLAIMQTNDNQLFLEEFGSIDMTPQYSTDVANLPLNRAKNRYNNILPYDHSRVKLSSHKHSTDYINANYLAGYMKQKMYIATQGPIPETIGDFWRMVWEQDCRTIVMLTNPHEKGKLKCEVYWPREVGASSLQGSIEVTLTDMTQLADYTIRSFTVHKGGTTKEPREVQHFHFTSWPDHGVPQYATAMLSMLRRIKSWQPSSESAPVIVHCSAGVGRSGTYIVIDTMLERLKNADELIDIYGHVSLLRTQRPFMVQTEDQYFFIHEAVAEALLCGNTEVPLERLHSYVQELCSIIPEDDAGHTHMELQFKRLALDRNDPNRFVTATKEANKAKNRYVNVLPYENNRVYLEFMRGVDGSDYINGSYIDSYHTRRAFIATQGPLPGTVVDFWRMVWQYNAPVIVMLTECVEKGTERSACYWPVEVRTSLQYDKFLVELAVERNSTHYSYRDLYITNSECQQRRLVRQFHFHSWPEVGVPSNPMVLVEFIREVQKLYTKLNTKAPMVIHCSNGVGRTGVFITLHIVLERLLVEGLADIFQAVKNLRIQRPAMVQSLDQYHFCYDATVDYIESTDMAFNLRQRSHSNLTTASSESKRKSRPSAETTPTTRSPARNSHTRSGSLSRNTPVRTDSFKGSARNLELNQLGNGGSQIYGGSEGTSTFGNHRRSSSGTSPQPTGSRNGSQVQLNTLPRNGNNQHNNVPQNGSSQLNCMPQNGSGGQIHSQGLSQPLSGSQPHLYLGGGSYPKLNNMSDGNHQSGLSDGMIGYHGANVQIRGAPTHQLVESQRYSTTSTNRSSTGES